MKHLVNIFALFTCVAMTAGADDFDSTTATVGRIGGGLETPVNQVVTPAGTLVELPRMRPQALALSPNGKLLVTAGLTHELVVLDPVTELRRIYRSTAMQEPVQEAFVRGLATR